MFVCVLWCCAVGISVLCSRPGFHSAPPFPMPPCFQEFPSLVKPLLTERDQYMTFMLRKLAPRAQTVVAVVGAGHLQGIRDHWEKEICIAEITAMPAERQPQAWRWRRLALLTAGGVLVGSALLRMRR